MNLYEVKYLNQGEERTQVVPANDKEDAIEKILDMGIDVIIDVQVYAKLGNSEEEE